MMLKEKRFKNIKVLLSNNHMRDGSTSSTKKSGVDMYRGYGMDVFESRASVPRLGPFRCQRTHESLKGRHQLLLLDLNYRNILLETWNLASCISTTVKNTTYRYTAPLQHPHTTHRLDITQDGHLSPPSLLNLIYSFTISPADHTSLRQQQPASSKTPTTNLLSPS